jgi:hypothetical protein
MKGVQWRGVTWQELTLRICPTLSMRRRCSSTAFSKRDFGGCGFGFGCGGCLRLPKLRRRLKRSEIMGKGGDWSILEVLFFLLLRCRRRGPPNMALRFSLVPR